MSERHEDDMTTLTAELRALTTWDGGATSLWRDALGATKDKRAARIVIPRVSRSWLSVAAVVIVAVTAFLLVDPWGERFTDASGWTSAPSAAVSPPPPPPARPAAGTEMGGGWADRSFGTAGGTGGGGFDGYGSVPADPTSPATARQVAHKVVIEVTVPDVRAAYRKATHLVSEASGEFIEDSALRGDDDAATAELTLRVAASRLATVLDGLRALGDVRSENARADDVTDQRIDLDSRLRNEQQIEQELRELIASRDDAPLDDILTVRQHLGTVRGQIERLQAQIDALDGRVAYATVSVLIRPPATTGAADEATTEGFGAYFARVAGGAWDVGLRTLANTVAGLLRVFVGGLVWWPVLLFLCVVGRRWWQKHVLAM